MLPRPLLAALLALLAAACASGSHRVELEMPAANEAVVRVSGKYPGLRVLNEGPGRLEVHIDAPVGMEAAKTVYLLEPGEELERRLARPTVVRLRTLAGHRAFAVIETRDSDGFHIQSAPTPVGG